MNEAYPAIETLNSNISVLVKQASEVQIIDDQTMADSSDSMKLLKGLLKKVDTEEKSFTKPINDHLKKLRAQFKPLKETIDTSVNLLKQKQSTYLVEKRKAEQAEAARKQKEFEERALQQAEQMQKQGLNEAAETMLDVAAEIKAPDVKVKSQGNYSSTSIRRSVSYQVDDLKLVDRSLLCVDDKAVKALISDLRDKFTREADLKGLSKEKVSDYVYEQFSKGQIGGIKLIINESVVTR